PLDNEENIDANDLYRDLNVNLEGRDADMTDAPQTTQVIEDTHVTLTPVNPEGHQQSSSVSSRFISNMLNPNPDIGIDSILNTKSTSLVEIPVTSVADTTPSFTITLPPPPLPLIQQRTQTPLPIPTTAPKFIQTNQYATTLSSIPNIIDNSLGSKLKEVVDVVVQLNSDRIREEAQAENEDFLNKLNDNIKKIIKDQVKQQVKAQVSKIFPRIEKTINEQLEAEVMTRSSTESNTSHDVAANLSELELKKILIDKMESNNSIHRSDEQKNLYKALVEPYESDKLTLDTYGDTVSFKRHKDDEDKDEEPSATTGKSTDGSKSQHKSAGKSAHTEEPMHTDKDLEEPAHQEFDIGATEEQSDQETSQHPNWFQKPAKIPTPDRNWNKTLPAVHGPVQPWLRNLARE
ncbi:hypothetical protein Tco_0574094, partial [Tanacetum coccineum]